MVKYWCSALNSAFFATMSITARNSSALSLARPRLVILDFPFFFPELSGEHVVLFQKCFKSIFAAGSPSVRSMELLAVSTSCWARFVPTARFTSFFQRWTMASAPNSTISPGVGNSYKVMREAFPSQSLNTCVYSGKKRSCQFCTRAYRRRFFCSNLKLIHYRNGSLP